jgi:protein ImuB
VQAAELRAEQMSLFGPRAPAPARLATTLARLSSLVGPDRVGAPVVPDTHDPAAFDLAPFAPPALDDAPASTGAPSRSLARRMLRPPRVAEVFCDRALPTYVRADGMGGRVVQIAGPWRTRHGWWRGEGESHRDDFDVTLSDGGVYRIFHDLVNGGWFIDAQYD